MENPLNNARVQRAIALFFLALVLFGAAAALARSFWAASAAPHDSRPPAAEATRHSHESVPSRREQT